MAASASYSQNPQQHEYSDADDSLKLLSQDTYAHLFNTLKQEPGGETYTKIIEHQPTYTYETSGEDTITRCEISIDTLIPTTLLSQQSQQNMSQQSQQSSLGLSSLQSQGLLSQHQFIIPTTPMFTNYSGQVPEPHINPAQMNFTDSGAGVMQPPPPSMSPSPMSAIPSNTHYTGGYNFKLDIGKQTKDTKATAWTFSPGMNKLYAQKDAMVPVKFSIACDGVANRLFIRALPVYSRPEHLSDVVKRCPYHSQSPESANIPHREHFIWCENQGASYVQDQQTGRYAAVMPYDTPPAGTEWVTYLFSFKCLNSCVGGPNRREMSIIFTLEDANAQVLGRLCVDLRICACPGRDRKSDENKMNTSTAASTPTTPASTTSQAGHSSASNTPVSTSGPTHSHTNKTEPATPLNHTACEREMYAVSKRSRTDSSCETFSLTVRGKKNYELLSRIRDSLEMTEQLVPHGERDRYVQQRRQNDDNTGETMNNVSSTTASPVKNERSTPDPESHWPA